MSVWMRASAMLLAQAVGHHEVVDAPAGVLFAGTETVRPPRVGHLLGIFVAERVGEAAAEQLGEALALLVGESGVATVGLGVLQVHFLMGHVHVAADDDGFLLVEPTQISLEVGFPLHAVVQAPQSVLRIGRIDGDEIERGHFERDDAPLVVVLVDADAVADAQRLMAREDGRAAVALLVGVVPIGTVALEVEVELPLLHLGFLQTEEVGIQLFEHIAEAFAHAGSQAVDIPGNEVHEDDS